MDLRAGQCLAHGMDDINGKFDISALGKRSEASNTDMIKKRPVIPVGDGPELPNTSPELSGGMTVNNGHQSHGLRMLGNLPCHDPGISDGGGDAPRFILSVGWERMIQSHPDIRVGAKFNVQDFQGGDGDFRFLHEVIGTGVDDDGAFGKTQVFRGIPPAGELLLIFPASEVVGVDEQSLGPRHGPWKFTQPGGGAVAKAITGE